MTEEKRWSTPATQHIRNLFEETRDGAVDIAFYAYDSEPLVFSRKVEWSLTDAEELVKKYEALTAALTKIGRLRPKLTDEQARNELLTESEREVWETYVRDFEPFEIDPETVRELYMRGEFDELTDDENEILERHYKWCIEQSLKRLPRVARTPEKVINRAKRYECLVRLGAPQSVLEEEGRCLAEQMILYYYGKQEAQNGNQ